MGDRCTGRCCHGFLLGGVYPAELDRWFAEHGSPEEDEETRFIKDSFYMMGYQTHSPLGGEYPEPVPAYSCKHAQENGDCGIYESRPPICRKYPNGRDCIFTECEGPDARPASAHVVPLSRLQARKEGKDRSAVKGADRWGTLREHYITIEQYEALYGPDPRLRRHV